MTSLIKSNKGVETAPLFIVFSAIVILLAAGIILPELGKWNANLDKAKTIRESQKVAAACDEVLKMGETGSVEQIHVDVPKYCCVQITDGFDNPYADVFSICSIPNQDADRHQIHTDAFLKSKIDSKGICETSVDVIIAYGTGDDKNIPQGSYIIYVTSQKPFIR